MPVSGTVLSRRPLLRWLGAATVRYRAPFALLLAMTLLFPVPAGSAPHTPSAWTAPTVTALSATLPSLTREGKARTVAALASTGDSAHFVRTGAALTRAAPFPAGSLTKTFVATVVLQLAAEGELLLDEPVDTYLPGLVRGNGNDGRAVTLRQLLTHTSGLRDFATRTRGTGRVPAARALTIALEQRPTPRGEFRYSNTNYVVLGEIVERVTGRSYAQEIRRRLLVPLGLTGTRFPAAPRAAGASGDLVSTLDDLNAFHMALLSGALLAPPQLRTMLDTRATGGVYGMGVLPTELPCGVTVWGHAGRVPGTWARSAVAADGTRAVTYRTDTDAPPRPGGELPLLTAVFCPPGTRPAPAEQPPGPF